MSAPVEVSTAVEGRDQMQHALITLVTEEGRLDPAALTALTAGLVDAVGRMSTLGATGTVAKAEIVGLRDLAASVDAARQVSIAAYATRYVYDWNGHQGPVSRQDADDVAEECHDEFCEADLAPSLRMGRNAAAHRISAAVAMTTVLSRTLDALTVGRIDEPRARTIASELSDASDRVALAVEELVLPGPGGSPPAPCGTRSAPPGPRSTPTGYARPPRTDPPSGACRSPPPVSRG